MAPKALIVEADRGLIHALEAALKSEGFEVVVAHNGVAALRAMQVERPDIVILDPMLAWLGGERIRQTPRPGSRATGPPIIALSPKSEESERIPPTGTGDDSVARFFDAKEVLAHVRTLQRRAVSAGSGGILRAGALEMDVGHWTVSVDGKPVSLTAKEFGLLRILLNAKGRILTRDMLRESGWERGKAHEYGSRTLDVHIGRLRRKLGPAGRYILTVRGVGYRFGVPPERRNRGRDRKA